MLPDEREQLKDRYFLSVMTVKDILAGYILITFESREFR
jgi:hypothetical protein